MSFVQEFAQHWTASTCLESINTSVGEYMIDGVLKYVKSPHQGGMV